MAESKKILVLVMSCNSDHFQKEEEVCRETWAKPILDGKYENIEYYSYTGGAEEGMVDKEKRMVYCSSPDGLWDTHKKTVECINLLNEENVEYDYIFRTNTSTVNNIGLLNAFVNTLTDDMVAWGGELYCIGIPCPFPKAIYLRGNSILLSKKLCDLIIDWTRYIRIPKVLFADDNLIGNILNCYHIMRFEDYRRYIKSYGFAWYKSIGFYDKYLDNGCSNWGNVISSYDYLKNFISIQIKTYHKNRDIEFERMKLISDIVTVDKEDYSQELEFIKKYSEKPMYFYNNTNEKVMEYRTFEVPKKLTE